MYFDWNGCNVEEFEFEGKRAFIAIPKNPKPNADFLFKTEYWGAYPDIERRMVEEHGYYSVGIKHQTRFSPDSDLECDERFIDYVRKKYSLAEKCSLVGMSMGGSHAVKFAGKYPKKVKCIFIDAPVLNYFSFPVNRKWEVTKEEFLKAYPMEKYELFGSDIHPICKVKTLIENKIPVLLVYGKEDATVPYEESGLFLEEAYKNHPELLTVVPVNNRGHHPHGFMSDNTPIVEFILKNS